MPGDLQILVATREHGHFSLTTTLVLPCGCCVYLPSILYFPPLVGSLSEGLWKGALIWVFVLGDACGPIPFQDRLGVHCNVGAFFFLLSGNFSEGLTAPR